MPEADEIALVKSAAPASISDRATVKLFAVHGYEVSRQGDNGWVCLVMRGFTGASTFTPVEFRAMAAYDPKFLAPICLNPDAVKTVLPYYELRTKLAIDRKTPEEIAEAVRKAYAKGDIPKRDRVSFAYMWSADLPGVGDEGTPFSIVVIPVDDNLAIKAQR